MVQIEANSDAPYEDFTLLEGIESAAKHYEENADPEMKKQLEVLFTKKGDFEFYRGMYTALVDIGGSFQAKDRPMVIMGKIAYLTTYIATILRDKIKEKETT